MPIIISMQESLIDLNRIEEWFKNHHDFETVQKLLEDEILTPETRELYLKEYKKKVYAFRQQRGFIFMVAGAFIGFISCVLSVTNPFPELYEWILYGLTSVSICVIFIGLYYFFE